MRRMNEIKEQCWKVVEYVPLWFVVNLHNSKKQLRLLIECSIQNERLIKLWHSEASWHVQHTAVSWVFIVTGLSWRSQLTLHWTVTGNNQLLLAIQRNYRVCVSWTWNPHMRMRNFHPHWKVITTFFAKILIIVSIKVWCGNYKRCAA